MPDEPVPPPVLSYIFGNLTTEEAEQLQKRALEDPSLFDELWDASAERELLQDPAARARLLRTLEVEEAPSIWARIRQWFTVPSARYALAGATALALVAAFYLGTRGHTTGGEIFQVLSIVTDSASDAGVFFTLPLRDARAVVLDLGRSPAVFHPGDIVRATVRLRRAGAVFVLRSVPGGQAQIVYPSEVQTSADQKPGALPVAFDPVPATTDIRAPQKIRLRVLLLPVGTDLRTQSIDWQKLGPDYAAVEASYSVTP